MLVQQIDGLFHPRDGRRVDDDVAARVRCAGRVTSSRVCVAAVALPHQVAQVGPVKAGNVLVGLAQLQLLQNVVPHVPRGAGREGRDGAIRKMLRAERSAGGTRDETRVPIPRCNALRRWRRKRSACAAASRSCPRAPAARAKDRAADTRPARALRMTRDCSSRGIELFSTAAGMPICASCAAWSCISAISGETTTAVRPSTSAGNW